jgi:hypothetical protein
MNDNFPIDMIPVKVRKEMRDRKIRALYRSLPKEQRSMDQVVLEMRALGYGVSKTTVFFAINGRSKKPVEKRKIKK